MKSRKKFLIVFFIIYLIISGTIFFGLKSYSKKNFNPQVLNELMIGRSKYRDVTDNLCHYQILGEPDVGKNYIKINFWCVNGSKARSTFSLAGFEDKTTNGIIKEYARIIGFNVNIIKEKKWYCTLNGQEIDSKSINNQVLPASTIDCFEKKGLSKND